VTTTTHERRLLLPAPMVAAVRECRKTQHRAPIVPAPLGYEPQLEPSGKWVWWRIENGKNSWDERRCPFGAPGDRLWIPERIIIESFGAGVAHIRYFSDVILGVRSRMVSDRGLPNRCCVVPATKAPRHTARTVVEIESVRVERLDDIDPFDCVAEGADVEVDHAGPAFMALWDARYASRGYPWESSPWVWAVAWHLVEATT